MFGPEFFVGMICGVGFWLAVLSLIGAVILRAACAIFNRMAGGADAPEAVPGPRYGKAVGIVFVSWLVTIGVMIVIGLVGSAIKAHPLAVYFIVYPVVGMVTAVIVSSMLPTTFGKAAVVTLWYAAIGFGIIIAIWTVLIIAIPAIQFARFR
jgi:hypothetical protein